MGAAAARGLARPVIVAGNGVRIGRAQKPLCELAELLGAPVATTASGKGVFPETHPRALGVLGNFGLEAANAAVGQADVVLAIGTKLGPTDTCNENPALFDPRRQSFIEIDIEPRNAAWSFPADCAADWCDTSPTGPAPADASRTSRSQPRSVDQPAPGSPRAARPGRPAGRPRSRATSAFADLVAIGANELAEPWIGINPVAELQLEAGPSAFGDVAHQLAGVLRPRAGRARHWTRAYDSGTKTEMRGSGPTSRVSCPWPDRSSAIRMLPGPRRRRLPSPTVMSTAPRSVMTA